MNKLPLWERLKRKLRSTIYPRHFKVMMEDELSGDVKTLEFTAVDKGEMSGRFIGPCEERIIVKHEDFERSFGSKGLWSNIRQLFSGRSLYRKGNFDDSLSKFF